MSEFWKDRMVLVTGGGGFLGGYVVGQLLKDGASVVGVVRDRVPGWEAKLAGCAVVMGCVEDQELMERVMGEYEIDTVLHLAAQTLVPVADRNPVSTFTSNVAGTWSVLEAARRSALVKAVVVASSDKAYGVREEGAKAYTEEMRLAGRSPYDVSKSCADLIAQSYASMYGLPVAVTRCGNLYGGGDLNWNRLIPGTIRSIARGERPLVRSDGRLVRDYFYVKDGAEATLKLAEALRGDGGLTGACFNFSSERPMAVLAMVRRLLGAMGSDLEPEVLDQASAAKEIPEQVLDAGKARAVLGWRPRHSFDESVEETVAWYGDYFGWDSGRVKT